MKRLFVVRLVSGSLNNKNRYLAGENMNELEIRSKMTDVLMYLLLCSAIILASTGLVMAAKIFWRAWGA